MESPRDEFRVGRMGALYRRALDACLGAGVQWAPATRVASLEPDGAGSTAALERADRRERLRALTAGGLDPCLRLSALAAAVALEFLATGDEAALESYDGAALRARFRTRLVLRRVLKAVRSPAAAELACAALRLPPLRAAARQVFFGRGSFPDTAPSRASNRRRRTS